MRDAEGQSVYCNQEDCRFNVISAYKDAGICIRREIDLRAFSPIENPYCSTYDSVSRGNSKKDKEDC